MKIFLRKLILILLLLPLCGLLRGQVQFIPLNVDYAVFNSEGDTEFLEVYLSFRQKSLMYVQNDSGFSANFTSDRWRSVGPQVRPYDSFSTF